MTLALTSASSAYSQVGDLSATLFVKMNTMKYRRIRLLTRGSGRYGNGIKIFIFQCLLQAGGLRTQLFLKPIAM